MVDLCPVVKWSGIQMVVWKPDLKKPVYGSKCQVFPPNQMTLPFEYLTPILSGIQMVTVKLNKL